MACALEDPWEKRQFILQCITWMCASPFEIIPHQMATDDGDQRRLATSPSYAFLKGKEKSLEC